MSAFSLPTQRCFWAETLLFPQAELFSAYAEVFLIPKQVVVAGTTFLCLRRGVSPGSGRPIWDLHFSLPTQRCFLTASRAYPVIALFSAYAEVFPGCICFAIFCVPFLCLRRGVSETVSASFALAAFSLPTQRCFLVVPAVGVRDVLFSAYAEVFPGISVPQAICLTFLCLRRGVSTKADEVLAALRFSLPTQRCFLFSDLGVSWKDLFSAYAEVFLAKTLLERRRTHFSLPTQEGEENFVGDSEIIALGGASNETKDRPLG